MTFHSALLDLDGTLQDSAACVVEATRAAFTTHGLVPPDAATVRARIGVPIERSFPEMGAAHPDAPWAEVIACFRSVYSALAPERVRPFPGIPEILSALHARGIPLVIVTSKRRSIAEADCARTGLATFLAGVVGSDCSTRHKPDPEPATLACARYGITPGPGTLVVGDAAVDLRMGRAAGLSTCAALWGAHSPRALLGESPDRIAREPRDLLAFFSARS